MSSTIKVILETGVIASTEKQKRTVLGLGLKYRNAVNTLQDTPAIRGMVNKVSHLVRILDKDFSPNPWAALPPAYELGAVKQKVDSTKKKSSKKTVAADEVTGESKPKIKTASAKVTKEKVPATVKKTKTPTKKVKGK